MKINKTQLKAIIKECLVEILQENMTISLKMSQDFSPVQTDNRVLVQNRQQTKAIVPESKRFNPELDQRVVLTNAVKQIAKDPIMASMLEDTAATLDSTTIRESQQSIVGKPAPTEQFKGSVEEVFGSASKLWSTLAFQ